MIRRVILSVIVAVAAGLLTALVGHGLVDAGVPNVGNFLKGIAVLVGVLAGAWYFFAGPEGKGVYRA